MGKAQFTKVTAVATMTAKQLESIDSVVSTTVPKGSWSDAIITPDPGVIAKVVSCTFQVLKPADLGAVSGTHSLRIAPNWPDIALQTATANYNQKLDYLQGHVLVDGAFTGAGLPSDPVVQARLTEQMWFDSNIGIRFGWKNNTDRDLAPTRTLRMIVLTEVVD